MLKADRDPRGKRDRSAAVLFQAWLPLLLLLLGLFAATPPSGAADEPFQVVVNGSNPVSSLSAQEVSRMFLKKVARWPNGGRVMPVDLHESSGVRESFSQRIHGKETAAVEAYWQRLIFSGRDVPPPEKSSAAEVLAYVRGHEGAIGYVPAGTALGNNVRTIRVSP